MERTRAERRFQNALVKNRAWKRSVWSDICKQENAWSRSKRKFVQVDEEFIKNCMRLAVRNDGKWRHAGMKKWYGCGATCAICNPQIAARWKDKTKIAEINKMDMTDFNDEMSGYLNMQV